MNTRLELFKSQEQQKKSLPLGMLENLPLTPEQMAKFQFVDAFDMSPMQKRLAKENRLPEVWIPEATLEFKRYMGLYIAGGTQHSVSMFSQEIDEVWHMLILYTRKYQQFCDEAFGEFLHHNPYENGDPDPKGSWEDFSTRYQLLYGPVTHLWTMYQPSQS